MGMRSPIGGYDWNPLRDYPRNNPCFCGSGVKAKRCCIPRLHPCVKQELADQLKKYVDYVKTGKGEPVNIKVNKTEGSGGDSGI
jgi:hypothetical protein